MNLNQILFFFSTSNQYHIWYPSSTTKFVELGWWKISYHDFIKNQAAGWGNWESNLENGFVETASNAGISCNVGAALANVQVASGSANGMELFVYEKVSVGDGSLANNPLLQEMPDPISKPLGIII